MLISPGDYPMDFTKNDKWQGALLRSIAIRGVNKASCTSHPFLIDSEAEGPPKS